MPKERKANNDEGKIKRMKKKKERGERMINKGRYVRGNN